MLDDAMPDHQPGAVPPQMIWRTPKFPAGVAPKSGLAMDDAFSPMLQYALSSQFSEGITFLGYPYLAELSQRPEYRRPVEIIAKAMTRKWIRVISKSDSESQAEKIKQIEADLKEFRVQHHFNKLAELDGYFGRGQLYIDTGATDDPDELRAPCPPLDVKVPIGSLKGFVSVEPMWSYPNNYNSNDPLSPIFFKPTSWLVNGKEVHASRLLTIVSRHMPDILKPVYAFGGLSLTQMLKPYVDNWIRTRQSVSDLVNSFSIMGLKTNMSEVLNGGAASTLYKRVAMFNRTRNNRSTMVLDKELEDFFNVSAPLGTLDALQAQSQEHMASVAGIPLIILFAITPTGLNASSDAELKTFADWILSLQESIFTEPLDTVLRFIQLNRFGAVDDDIGFKFEPITGRDMETICKEQQMRADTAVKLIDAGVISQEEERQRLADDEDSGYAGLDVENIPAPPAEEGISGHFGKFGEITPEHPDHPDHADAGEPTNNEQVKQ